MLSALFALALAGAPCALAAPFVNDFGERQGSLIVNANGTGWASGHSTIILMPQTTPADNAYSTTPGWVAIAMSPSHCRTGEPWSATMADESVSVRCVPLSARTEPRLAVLAAELGQDARIVEVIGDWLDRSAWNAFAIFTGDGALVALWREMPHESSQLWRSQRGPIAMADMVAAMRGCETQAEE